jgi:hypothetical protein
MFVDERAETHWKKSSDVAHGVGQFGAQFLH